MKSLIYTLATILGLVFISMDTNAQAIVGYSDLFTFDTRLTHVQGTITDEGTGNPIEGARISIGQSPSTTSDASGLYSCDSVLAGNCNVLVFKIGFEEYSENVMITGDAEQTINISLTPGEGNYVPINDELIAFSDNKVENPTNFFTLSGNVHINNVLHFDGPITIDKRTSLYNPEINGSCGFYATNIGNYSTYWIKNNNIAFEFEADDDHLIPTMWEYLLDGSFDIGGFNIIIGGIIIDPAFDFVEIVSIPKMPFPINKVMEFYNAMGNMDLFIEKMSGNKILSKANGEGIALDIDDFDVNIGLVEMEDIHLYFNTNTQTFGGAFTLNIPGDDDGSKQLNGDSTGIDFETGRFPVEIRDENDQVVDSLSFNDFIESCRSGGFRLLSVGAAIEFVHGSINKIVVSIGTNVALGTTGLFLTEISGGLEDLATEHWKIIANVDIELGFEVPVLGPPVKLNDFGVEIQPWNTFSGGGEFQVFNQTVSDGYIEYNRPESSLYAECNLDLGGILEGQTIMSLVGGQVNGSGLLSIHTPSKSKLKWYLRWAGNKNIGSAQSDLNNQYFQSSVRLGWIKLAHKLKFGKTGFPWFHYYLGKNLNNLHKIWKGKINGRQAIAFEVEKNAKQLLVVAMDTLNPTLFDFNLQNPLGQIYDKENAYYYETNDEPKQTIMSLLKPMAGEWLILTNYGAPFETHISITNQEPTFLTSQPSETRSRSNQISLKINDYSDTLKVQVYYTSKRRQFNGTMINEFRVINNGKLDFVWQNQHVPNGEYFIYCRIDDGYNPPYLQYAPGSVWVENHPGIESPVNFEVMQEGNSFFCNWDEAESASIVAATVYYKNISSGRTAKETVFKSTSATLKDLKPGQEYQLWACFIDEDGSFSEPGEKVSRIFRSEERNNPPYFTLNPDSMFIFVEGQQQHYTLTANDADGDALTFSVPNDTLGIKIFSDVLSWTPTEDDRGVYNLKITVSDGSNTVTTYQQLVVYTAQQVSVDLAFSSINLYENDNMFVKINNFFCPDIQQQITLRNTRTQEEISIETRRVNDFEYIGQFGLSFIDRSDISVANGDTIEAKYMYMGDDYYSYSYYDSLPQPSDNVPPGIIDDLGIEQLMNNEINLKWTATGNDADSGKAYSYDIRYAYEPIITEDVYYTANRILIYPYPSPTGELDSLLINLMELDGIAEHDNIYFSIKAEDEMQNRGGLSNSPGLPYILNPTNLTAVIENVYQIALNWDGPLPGKQIAGLQYYEVFRKIDQGEFSLLETGVVQTDFTDDLKTDPDGTYQYAIQAIYDTDNSDTVYTPAVLMERFVNVSITLSLQDTNNYQGIVYDINGLDDVYSQEFNGTTNSTGLEAFDNVFYGLYEITASKENYVSLLDTISVSKDYHSFNLELVNNLGNIDITAGKSQFFKIYPNPNEGAFTLELFEVNAISGIQVEIYSLLGEKVKQVELEGQLRYEFDLSTIPKGVYLIRVIKGHEQGFMKLIRK